MSTNNQTTWIFHKCVDDYGFAGTSPKILVVGDNGTQVNNIITVFPAYDSIDLMEIDATNRALAATALAAHNNITILAPDAFDSSGKARAYDFVVCTYVLCRYPEDGEGPLTLATYQACIDELFGMVAVDGFLVAYGSNYSLEDYAMAESKLLEIATYPTHAPTYNLDGTTLKSSTSGSFIARRFPPTQTFGGFTSLIATTSTLTITVTVDPLLTALLDALDIVKGTNTNAVRLQLAPSATCDIAAGTILTIVAHTHSLQITCVTASLALANPTPTTFLNLANVTSTSVVYI